MDSRLPTILSVVSSHVRLLLPVTMLVELPKTIWSASIPPAIEPVGAIAANEVVEPSPSNTSSDVPPSLMNEEPLMKPAARIYLLVLIPFAALSVVSSKSPVDAF